MLETSTAFQFHCPLHKICRDRLGWFGFWKKPLGYSKDLWSLESTEIVERRKALTTFMGSADTTSENGSHYPDKPCTKHISIRTRGTVTNFQKPWEGKPKSSSMCIHMQLLQEVTEVAVGQRKDNCI